MEPYLQYIVYAEEELKRTQNPTHQFNYNYDNEIAEKRLEKSMGPTLPTEEEDEPFVAPPELDIPVNMALVCCEKDRLCRNLMSCI